MRTGIVVAVGLVFAVVLAALLACLPSPANVFGGLLLPPLAILTLRYPGAVFAAYLYIPFYKGAVQIVSPIDITAVLAVACLVLTILHLRLTRWQQAMPVLTGWVALMALLAVGVMTAGQHPRAIEVFVTSMALVFLPLLFGIVVGQTPRYQRQFLTVTFLLSGIVTVLGVVQLGSTPQFGRVSVAGSNTIGTSRAALLLVVVTVVGWKASGLRGRLLSATFVPLSLVVALGTGSRGPVLALAITLVAMSLMSIRHIGRLIVAAAGASVVAFGFARMGILESIVPDTSLRRMTSTIEMIFGGGDIDRSSGIRLALWEVAVSMFEAKPVLGFGTGSFANIANQIPGMQGRTYPHNLILQFLAEFGLVGLGVLIFLLLLVARRVLAVTATRERVIVALTVFALINAMVSNSIYDNRWLWGMIVMTAAIPVARTARTRRSPICSDRAACKRQRVSDHRRVSGQGVGVLRP